MIPCSFDESNVALSRPDCMSDEQCQPLSVFRGPDAKGQPIVISCWKFTVEEVELLAKTGRIWLWVYGEVMPPVALDVVHPFIERKPE